jgi:hypothetical protein
MVVPRVVRDHLLCESNSLIAVRRWLTLATLLMPCVALALLSVVVVIVIAE